MYFAAHGSRVYEKDWGELTEEERNSARLLWYNMLRQEQPPFMKDWHELTDKQKESARIVGYDKTATFSLRAAEEERNSAEIKRIQLQWDAKEEGDEWDSEAANTNWPVEDISWSQLQKKTTNCTQLSRDEYHESDHDRPITNWADHLKVLGFDESNWKYVASSFRDKEEEEGEAWDEDTEFPVDSCTWNSLSANIKGSEYERPWDRRSVEHLNSEDFPIEETDTWQTHIEKLGYDEQTRMRDWDIGAIANP
eukprot:SAG11_NODE_2088_length_3844_cov_1.785905_2_plen_252_part_00